jgi:hypothetical protein
MRKRCEITITYCNSFCPHFFHKFSDHENCWCKKLNKKIFDVVDAEEVLFDFVPRKIPDECPLENTI